MTEFITVEQTRDFLLENDGFLLLTHSNPDGDAAGSVAAMYRILKKLGKNVAFSLDTLPKNLAFLAPEQIVPVFSDPFVISLDCGSAKQIGGIDGAEGLRENVSLSIDHHAGNTPFAKYTLLDGGKAAACELVYEVARSLGVDIDERIAECLYVGISTDTGCFRYANTTPQTHEIAASLMKTGFDCAKVNRLLFETVSKAYIRFESEVI
nr:DHH family phosphoesterase [Clostridia bacterium]